MKKIFQQPILLALLLLLFSVTVFWAEEIKLDKYQMMAYRGKPAVIKILSAVAANVSYLRDNTPQQEQAVTGGTGSGFIINPEGYIVTNGHVVETCYEYEKDKEKVLNRIIVTFVVKKLKQEGQQVSLQTVQQWVQQNKPRIVQERAIRKVYLSNGDVYDYEIKKYSPWIGKGGKDVAIIKIEGHDLPVIQLGNSAELKLQQLVFPFGYPGLVSPDAHELLGEKTALEVSITRGTISALKMDYKGVPVIQTDAAITHGNSGGPAANENGEVIGVSTFGSTAPDPYTGKPTEVAGFNFLVPVNTAKEFIDDAGVKYNVPSKFNDKYNAALEAVWNKDWFKARELINSTLVFLPNQPDMIKLRQYVEGQLSDIGCVPRIWKTNKIAVISLVIILLLIIGIGLTLIMKRSSQAVKKPIPEVPRVEAPPTVEGKTFGFLTLSTGGQLGKSYPVGEKGLVIGREPGQCDIIISDPNVSRIHAWVTVEKGEIVVIDRGSTNGTFVNNNKVEKTKLKSGDVIQLGQKCPTSLLFKQ